MESVADYLEQGELWVSKTGNVSVVTMDEAYKLRSARWLFRRADMLLTMVALDCDLNTALSLLAQNPRKWMQNQKLFQALVRGTNYDFLEADHFPLEGVS